MKGANAHGYLRRGRGRNPRRPGGVLLAVGTLLALGGLATVGHPAAGSVSNAGHARSGALADASPAAAAFVRVPISVPRAPAQEQEDAVEPDKLVGPKPAAPMDFSVPVRILVPQAGIDADVTPVGLVPHSVPGVIPLTRPQQVAWDALGPAPGQPGTALVDAHVEARTSDAVRPGDTLEVTRADHSLAIFTVDATEQIPAWRTPEQSQIPVPYAALGLVTCSGSLDTRRHGCLDHTVVYAHLTAERRLTSADRAY